MRSIDHESLYIVRHNRYYIHLIYYVLYFTRLAGLSEQLRRCLQQHGVRALFKSETTLRSHLVRPKDAVEPTKQEGVVYKIRCECGEVYSGNAGQN